MLRFGSLLGSGGGAFPSGVWSTAVPFASFCDELRFVFRKRDGRRDEMGNRERAVRIVGVVVCDHEDAPGDLLPDGRDSGVDPAAPSMVQPERSTGSGPKFQSSIHSSAVDCEDLAQATSPMAIWGIAGAGFRIGGKRKEQRGRNDAEQQREDGGDGAMP